MERCAWCRRAINGPAKTYRTDSGTWRFFHNDTKCFLRWRERELVKQLRSIRKAMR